MNVRRVLVGLCVTIAVLDGLQPLVLPWRPKFVGALLGAAFYTGSAIAVRGGWDRMAWAVLLLPIVPVTLLGLTAAGVEAPVEPDAPMIGVLGLQLAAAGCAAALLRSDP